VKTPAEVQALRYSFVGISIAAVTGIAHRLHINQTTVALMFLVMVLLTSAYWGLRYALLMAVIATAAFNFFFLPPVGTFTIADPQNWVALFAFLVTALVASNLAERARREAEGAKQRRLEVERLYGLSQRLLATDNVLELLNAAIAEETKADPDFQCVVDASRQDTGFETSPDSPLVQLLEKATGNQAGTVAFGTEAAQMMKLGGKAVVIGPGDIREAHRTGEFVPVDELERCAEVLKQAIKELC